MEMRGLMRVTPLITTLGTGLAGPLQKIRSVEIGEGNQKPTTTGYI